MNRVAVEKKVLSENQILADQLRERYRQHGICVSTDQRARIGQDHVA